MQWLPSTRKQGIMLGVRLVILALLVWGIGRAISQASNDLRDQQVDWWQFRPGWVLASACLYLVGMLPMGLFWFATLRALRQKPTLGETLSAFYMGHLGKYVPGKALVVVIRAGAISSRQVSTTVAAVTVFIETLTMMASGAFLAAAILAAQWRGQGLLVLLAVGLMIAAGLPTLPPIFRRLVRLLKIAKAHEEIDELLEGMSFRLVFCGWLGDLIGWTFIGASLLALLQALPSDIRPELSMELLPLLIASTSLAIVAGFVTPIPGGLGVREWVLNELMTLFQFRSVVSIVSSISLRIVWLLSELSISIILYLGLRYRRRRKSETTTNGTDRS